MFRDYLPGDTPALITKAQALGVSPDILSDALANIEDDPERTLRQLARLYNDLGHIERYAVRRLRQRKRPVTWEKIGGALGISKQAAHQRFSSSG